MHKLDLDKFRIYPRGFVGAAIGMRVQKNTTNAQLRFQTLSQSFQLYRPPANSIDPNPAVKELYTQYMRGTKVETSFDYKKTLIITATRAFGTHNFLYWIQQQYASPVVGDLHREFLDDTLNYIATGERRRRLETWKSIISMKDRGAANPTLSKTTNEFFNIGGSVRLVNGQRNISLIPVICDWLSHPDGYSDLIGTLHILFGETP